MSEEEYSASLEIGGTAWTAEPASAADRQMVEAEQAKARQRARWYAAKVVVMRILFGAAFLALWEGISGPWINPFFISKPSAILTTLIADLLNGRIWFHLQTSTVELAGGYVIGTITGLFLGLAIGRSRTLADVLDPYILMLYSIPRLVLAPLLILWLGIGIASKLALVALVVFFLVFFNTYSGVKNVNEELIQIARVMGATRLQIFRKVILRDAFPFIFTGLRMAVPYGILGMVIAEFLASNKGIGYYIFSATYQFDTARLFAGIMVLMGYTLILNALMKLLHRRFLRWKDIERQEVST